MYRGRHKGITTAVVPSVIEISYINVFLVDEKPIYRNRVGLAFRRLVKKAGIENFRFHDLRHDFCSRLIQAGEELSVVSELAGHSSIITTQRYAHLSPEAKRKAISSLNGFNLASIK